MPTTETVIETCESLWQRIVTGRSPETSVEDERERDEDYVSGFHNENKTWTVTHGDYAVLAVRTKWTTMNPGADTNGVKRKIEIRKGDELVFAAVQEDAAVRQKFGAGERFAGTDTIPAKPWTVGLGDIPVALLEEGAL